MAKLYAKTHEWVEVLEDNTALIGLSKFASDELGDIVFINLPEVDDDLNAHESFGDVESVKAVSDIESPVNGVVLEINEDLLDAPELVNQDPENTWLIKAGNVELAPELLSLEDYLEFVKE